MDALSYLEKKVGSLDRLIPDKPTFIMGEINDVRMFSEIFTQPEFSKDEARRCVKKTETKRLHI
jgi:hypothetical protein